MRRLFQALGSWDVTRSRTLRTGPLRFPIWDLQLPGACHGEFKLVVRRVSIPRGERGDREYRIPGRRQYQFWLVRVNEEETTVIGWWKRSTIFLGGVEATSVLSEVEAQKRGIPGKPLEVAA